MARKAIVLSGLTLLALACDEEANLQERPPYIRISNSVDGENGMQYRQVTFTTLERDEANREALHSQTYLVDVYAEPLIERIVSLIENYTDREIGINKRNHMYGIIASEAGDRAFNENNDGIIITRDKVERYLDDENGIMLYRLIGQIFAEDLSDTEIHETRD